MDDNNLVEGHLLKIVILSVILLLTSVIYLVPSTNAMICEYDSNPYLSKSIDFMCKTDNADMSQCVGIVSYNNLLIHVYPKIKDLLLTGRVLYFENRNGTKLVNIQFENDDLYDNMTYEFKVICASLDDNNIEEFSANLTMVNPTWGNLPSRGLWVKDNMPVILFMIMILTFGVVLTSMSKRKRI